MSRFIFMQLIQGVKVQHSFRFAKKIFKHPPQFMPDGVNGVQLELLSLDRFKVKG